MTRAAGRRDVKNNPRTAQVVPGSPEGRDIGLSALQSPSGSPIPGQDLHITNPPVRPQDPAVGPAKPPFRGMMAHGVPPLEVPHHDRAETRGHETTRHKTGGKDRRDQAPPVPVYLVSSPDAGEHPIRRTVVRKLQLPAASTADPIQIVGENELIVEVKLLNEDQTHHGRFSGELSNLVSGQGALIPKAATSYLTIPGQNTLYACSDDSGTPIISVIITYDAQGGAGGR